MGRSEDQPFESFWERMPERPAPYAPEIDGNVFLRNAGKDMQVGDIVDVLIEDADEHDLYGAITTG